MSGLELVAREQAVTRRVMFEGRIGKVTDFFGGAAPRDDAQAYLVAQRNYTVRPHFHPADQFQILLGAPGARLGRHPVGDLCVHYADAYTVYGPLVGGDPPLRYFTLRARGTDVTAFMPESRELLPPGRGRSLQADVERGIPREPGPRASVLFGGDGDGPRALTLGAGTGAPVTVPDSGPVGQFLFVVAGAIVHDRAEYGAESIGWQGPRRPAVTLAAGPCGAQVLVLRYPGTRSRAAAGGH